MNLKRHDLIAIIFFSVILTLVGAQSVFSFTGTMDVISPGAIEITDINATNYYKNDISLNERLEGDWGSINLETTGTLNTGQGANELYDMDQNVTTTSDVTFNGVSTSWIELGGDNQTVWPAENPFDQNLNTTEDVTFSTVDTGHGKIELYGMDQNVTTTDSVTFDTVDTGQGANELYDMDQNVLEASAVTFDTVDTGHGANELYDMDQHVLQASPVTFASVDTDYVNATEYYLNDVNITDPLAHPEQDYDYLITPDGSVYKAKNGTTGQIDIISSNGTEVFQYAIEHGYEIHFKDEIELDGHLLFNGTGISTPEVSWIVEGQGRSARLTQTNDNKRTIVVVNRAVFSFKNFKFNVPTSNTQIAFHLSAEGKLTESPCKYSQIDNVWVKGGNGDSTLAVFENLGHGLTVGYFKVQAPNGDALNISNPSSTINYGNSAFDHLELSADPVDGTALTIWSPDQNIEINSLTIHHLDCSTVSGTDLHVINSKRVQIDWLISEHFAVCGVNITGYSGKKSQQIKIMDSYIGVPSGSQALNVEYGEKNYIKATIFGDAGAGLVLNKGYNDKGSNEFVLDLRGSYNPYDSSDFTINLGVTAPYMDLLSVPALQKTPNRGITASVSDGDSIPHLNGITPTFYWAKGTIAGEIVTVTAVNSTHLTIAIKDDAGSPGTTQSVIWYSAWLGKP